MTEACIGSLYDGVTDPNTPGNIATDVNLPNGNAVVIRLHVWFIYLIIHVYLYQPVVNVRTAIATFNIVFFTFVFCRMKCV
jgi:hypothetical protein